MAVDRHELFDIPYAHCKDADTGKFVQGLVQKSGTAGDLNLRIAAAHRDLRRCHEATMALVRRDMGAVAPNARHKEESNAD